MGNILNGKNGIIFGALDENSIAWKVAEKCFENGANLVLTNAPIALRSSFCSVQSSIHNHPCP